jgi:hypothetical protein
MTILPQSCRLRSEGAAIKKEADGAVEIGAVAVNAGAFQALKHLGFRRSGRIVVSNRDNRVAGMNRLQNLGRGRYGAAVMAHFPQTCVFAILAGHATLNRFFRIALEPN